MFYWLGTVVVSGLNLLMISLYLSFVPTLLIVFGVIIKTFCDLFFFCQMICHATQINLFQICITRFVHGVPSKILIVMSVCPLLHWKYRCFLNHFIFFSFCNSSL